MNKYLAKIIATDKEGLQMISACSSGAKVKVSDIKYLESNKVFLLSIERIKVENENEDKKVNSICRFDFIDKVFEMGDLENLGKDELKNFIRHRVNTKMADLGLKPIIPAEEIDKGALKTMKWFDAVIAGKQQTDFFANRVTNYSKGHLDWSTAF